MNSLSNVFRTPVLKSTGGLKPSTSILVVPNNIEEVNFFIRSELIDNLLSVNDEMKSIKWPRLYLKTGKP